MNLLVPLAGLLGIEIEAITDRVKTLIIVNTVIAVFGVIGVVFLLIAGFLALSDVYGSIYAALIFGGVFVVLALAVFLGAKIGEGKRHRQIAERKKTHDTNAFITTAALSVLPVLLRSPTVRAVGIPAAAVAAFFLARKADDRPE